MNQPIVKALCASHGLPEPIFEHCFREGRKWRFDLCWPGHMLAVEVQGGIHTRGRHVRGAALEKEYEKLTYAAVGGWRVIFVTPEQVNNGKLFEYVKLAMENP